MIHLLTSQGYHNQEFVEGCRERGVSAHCAQIEAQLVEVPNARTMRRGTCNASLIVRRCMVQVLGWPKTSAGYTWLGLR
jgi:hypothetical protein